MKFVFYKWILFCQLWVSLPNERTDNNQFSGWSHGIHYCLVFIRMSNAKGNPLYVVLVSLMCARYS